MSLLLLFAIIQSSKDVDIKNIDNNVFSECTPIKKRHYKSLVISSIKYIPNYNLVLFVITIAFSSQTAKNFNLKEDEIALTFYSRLEETKLKIFLHHPGQFIRNIKSPIIDVTTKRENIAQKVILLISDVMNFKRRNKANEPCDERMTDDGENLRRKKLFFNSLFGIILFLNRCVFKKSRSEFIMGRCSMASVKLNNKSDTYIILALVSLAEFV